jgi:hypothetical protein
MTEGCRISAKAFLMAVLAITLLSTPVFAGKHHAQVDPDGGGIFHPPTPTSLELFLHDAPKVAVAAVKPGTGANKPPVSLPEAATTPAQAVSDASKPQEQADFIDNLRVHSLFE